MPNPAHLFYFMPVASQPKLAKIHGNLAGQIENSSLKNVMRYRSSLVGEVGWRRPIVIQLSGFVNRDAPALHSGTKILK